jgi:hypothetical protein
MDARDIAARLRQDPDIMALTEGRIYPEDSLDAAWAEAEAALPEGWTFEIHRGVDGHLAHAWPRTETYEPRNDLSVSGEGPAAALRSLAAELRERAG